MTSWTVRGNNSDCGHAGSEPVVLESAAECEDCVREGTSWVHLRRCVHCGHVGCCDNSPRRHATGHWRSTTHPIVASAEPDERWGWCYADEVLLVPAP